jgi:hypothetical protein
MVWEESPFLQKDCIIVDIASLICVVSVVIIR